MSAAHWDEALALARKALTLSSPNPRVGCVLTDASGQVIGRGFTQRPGEAHAEVMALRDAAARGANLHGATAWVTLEPCSHHGRTPPCADALVKAGVEHVHVAMVDPNPLVAGRGIGLLRRAGIGVELLPATDPVAIAARELNIGFMNRMEHGRPWLRLKAAVSLDGRTALHNGESQWITGEASRADGHAWRARACAVLTGVGTVLRDDPRMDVRSVPVIRQPDVVVMDSRLTTPPAARIFEANRRVFIYCSQPDNAKQAALEASGATVVALPASGQSPAAGVDVQAVMRDLARLEFNEIHVEAGATLNATLIRESLVDEFLIYLAPVLLGEGAMLAALGPLTSLSQGTFLRFHDVQRIGEDLRVIARRATAQSLRK